MPGQSHDSARDVPRVVLAAVLLDHVDELARALVREDLFTGLSEREAVWLREQYREIVPVVLPDALRCIVTGEHLSMASHDCVGSSASALRLGTIPFTAAVRGGIPAIRAFAAFIQTLDLPLTFGETTLLMGRAALIAQELGACWVEAWRSPNEDAEVDGATLVMASKGVGVESDPTGAELEMITLTAAGQSTEQIATATKYSSQAVRWHLSRLMRAWKVTNRPALIAVAFVRGVLVATHPPVDAEQRQLSSSDVPTSHAPKKPAS